MAGETKKAATAKAKAADEKQAKPLRRRRASSGKEPGSGAIRVRLVRSVIGCTERQRAVVKGLGLRRLNHVVERQDTPAVRGMIAKVSHLVEIVS